jgi:hypothetical protein
MRTMSHLALHPAVSTRPALGLEQALAHGASRPVAARELVLAEALSRPPRCYGRSQSVAPETRNADGAGETVLIALSMIFAVATFSLVCFGGSL